MTVSTFCVICGKKHRYKLGHTRRLRQTCTEKCMRAVYEIRLAAIGETSNSVRRKALSRLQDWREKQLKLLHA